MPSASVSNTVMKLRRPRNATRKPSGTSRRVQESQATALMAQQLPAVFLDYRRITSATTSIPVIVAVEHSPWPLILSLALLTALAAGGGFLALWVARPRTYNIPVGGGVQAVSVRPFERRTVSDAYGTRASVTGSMFGPPNVRTLADEMK